MAIYFLDVFFNDVVVDVGQCILELDMERLFEIFFIELFVCFIFLDYDFNLCMGEKMFWLFIEKYQFGIDWLKLFIWLFGNCYLLIEVCEGYSGVLVKEFVVYFIQKIMNEFKVKVFQCSLLLNLVVEWYMGSEFL